ncbi:CHAP domain-containing protein [Spirillospora albida]|uniref:CHAP domain-containing protein n=1 Tax=Spirillospora albida TaxID=58123 RepID=UPI00068C8B11|nr:CHAP domain-containing protein [Spirillospora albida]
MSVLNTVTPRVRRSVFAGLAAGAAAGTLFAAPAAEATTTPAAAQRMVSIALSQVGQGETNGYSKFGKWYGEKVNARSLGKAAWCDMFVSWVGDQAGVTKKVGMFSYTVSHAQWFDGKGRFDRTPRVGDLVFFDWNGGKKIAGIDHVGLVTKVNKNGTVDTVEGNVSDKVQTRTRYMSTIVGFGHPAYGQ